MVLHPGMELKAVSLKKFVRERVTAFKVPKKVRRGKQVTKRC